MRVYISGPITGMPKEIYMERFEKAERELKAAGHEVFNPAKANEQMPEWFSHGDFMKICYEELNLCNGIYMLEAWTTSRGALQEYKWAKELNIETVKL